MATKKDILAAALVICVAHKASEKLTAELTELLAPKSGGATIVVEDVYNAEEGTLLCSVSDVWLPATVDFFYEDKSGKSPFNGLRRLSRQAESIRKTHTKVTKASEAAIMNDVLDGHVSIEDANPQIAELKASKPDFSGVTVELPADEDETAPEAE